MGLTWKADCCGETPGPRYESLILNSENFLPNHVLTSLGKSGDLTVTYRCPGHHNYDYNAQH
tara:strand:+ start:466 stop:651 length:186 start_codon:yes stop_codon:yes gene_type:complete